MKTIKILDYAITYSEENNLISTIVDDQDRAIDFTDPERVHVIALYFSTNNCTIKNLYALDQTVNVSWTPNIVTFLMSYLSNPAATYLAIHNLASADSIQRMRRVIGKYAFHCNPNASKDAVETITKYLRVLTCIGNKAITDRLENALNEEDSAIAFMRELSPLMITSAQIVNYTKMLELYFGKINRELVNMGMLETLPLESVETRRATFELSNWAYRHKLIAEEQRIKRGTIDESPYVPRNDR